jgi:hypothetical protein
MEPLVSLELRWFFLRSLPSAVDHWFRKQLPGTELSPEDTREDIYLLTPLQEDVGIKLRADRLEIKWRESSAPFRGAHNVAGLAERWMKWSCADDQGTTQSISSLRFPAGPWRGIRKKRWQRKYEWDGRAFTPVSWRSIPEQGAALEMTHLEVDGRDDGTVLVEAFAPDVRRQDELLAVAVEYLWRDYPGPALDPGQSYGYSRWLANLP